MFSRTRFLFAAFTIFLTLSHAHGQEGQPMSHPPGGPGAAAASGPDKKYVELSHSKDSKIKSLANQYLELVKIQEWGGASGKTQVAKYVSHDPDLKRVKLSVASGNGKERTFKEFDVDVDKLNKTCQYRVKRIDILQKKLDELAATAGTQGGPEGPGSITASARGAHERVARGPESPDPGPGAAPPHPGFPAQPSTPEVDTSASEPDPIGFAELPPITPSATATAPAGPGAVPGIPVVIPTAGTTTPSPTRPGGSVDRKQWRNNLAAFAANINAGTDPTGKPIVDWGELRELREMNDIVVGQRSPEPPARSPEAETPAAISERLGDMHWQIVVDKVEEAPGGLVVPSFHPVELAKPLEIHLALDDAEDVQKWAKLAPGTSISVSARLSITEPYKITAKVKLADAK
jgi:hypothetical protein